MKVYLDNAATTAIDPQVIDEMTRIMRDFYGNPSSIHSLGRATRNEIEQARKKVAYYIGASVGEVFFTSGGTESNNMAIKCAVRDMGVKRIITSPVEHHCVLHSVECQERNAGVEVVYLNVDSQGHVDLEQLEHELANSDKTTLVTLMHANNEIGTLLDVRRVGELCKEHNAYFHSDTVQSVAHFPINLNEVNIHFISGGAHKFHGPKGVGFVYINSECNIKPLIDGGAQERNMRGGTENLYGIVGMAKALELACEQMEEHRTHIDSLRSYFKQRLIEDFDDVQFYGDQDDSYLYTVLSVSFPPTPKAELLLLNLDVFGVCVSSGSACSSGADKGSHVVEAIKGDRSRPMIRFSFAHTNTKEEIDYTITQLKQILPELVKA